MKMHLVIALIVTVVIHFITTDAHAKTGWKSFCSNLHKLRISPNGILQAKHNCKFKYFYTFKLKHSYSDLYYYVKDQDGAVDPIRTGYEIEFYSYLKKRLKSKKAKKKLTPIRTFKAVSRLIRAKKKDKTRKRPVSVNAFEVLLTAHNVTRILARPEQWSEILPKMSNGRNRYIYDSASGIIKDLVGQRSVDRLPSFKKLMGIRRFQYDRVYQTFFGKTGPYSYHDAANAAVGWPPAHWNGGIHYYFWVGAMAEEVGYSAGRGIGGWASVAFANIYETLQKVLTDNTGRAKVQLEGYNRGAKWWRKTRALFHDVRAARRSFEIEAKRKRPANSVSCRGRNGESCSSWNGVSHTPGQLRCRKSDDGRCLCSCRTR